MAHDTNHEHDRNYEAERLERLLEKADKTIDNLREELRLMTQERDHWLEHSKSIAAQIRAMSDKNKKFIELIEMTLPKSEFGMRKMLKSFIDTL